MLFNVIILPHSYPIKYVNVTIILSNEFNHDVIDLINS